MDPAIESMIDLINAANSAIKNPTDPVTDDRIDDESDHQIFATVLEGLRTYLTTPSINNGADHSAVVAALDTFENTLNAIE